MTLPRLVPELAVVDPAAAAEVLCRVFGFRPAAGPGRLELGNQQVRLRPGARAEGHGTIDHLALAVADLDAALAAALRQGGALDRAVTPEGPLFIPEFWEKGIAYVFLNGPGGARIELCARPGVLGPGLPGHDHIGIACTDLPAMAAFFRGLGFREIAATTLIRDSGNVPVAFLSLGESVVELYAPPVPATTAPSPPWHGLILEGTGQSGAARGPEGVQVTLCP